MTQHTETGGCRILWRLASRRVRAVLCLGIFAGPAAVGTMAQWSSEVTIEPGGFTLGTLDLTVGATPDASENLPGTGGEFAYSAITISDLLPGESIARPFAVKNSGTTRFTYNASVFTVNTDLVAAGSGLQVAVYSGGAPTNIGSEAVGNRAGSCPGGVLLKTQAVSTSTNTVKVLPTDYLLAPGAAQAFCVTIALHPGSPNTMQRKITQLVIELDAKQVTVP